MLIFEEGEFSPPAAGTLKHLKMWDCLDASKKPLRLVHRALTLADMYVPPNPGAHGRGFFDGRGGDRRCFSHFPTLHRALFGQVAQLLQTAE
jgi:hypothetical protein